MADEIRNAVIERAEFSTERGMLSAWLMLDYGDGVHQGFGGYALYLPRSNYANRGDVAGHFVWRCLAVAGVDDWCKLVGRPLRVRCEGATIKAIGHIVKDDWFDPSRDWAKTL